MQSILVSLHAFFVADKRAGCHSSNSRMSLEIQHNFTIDGTRAPCPTFGFCALLSTAVYRYAGVGSLRQQNYQYLQEYPGVCPATRLSGGLTTIVKYTRAAYQQAEDWDVLAD